MKQQETTSWDTLRKHRPGYVYVMGLRGLSYYKIGIAQDPVRRLSAIQHSNPHEVYIELVIETDAMHELEKQLHSHFDDKRIRREWFELTPDDLDYIRTVEGNILNLTLYEYTCDRCGKPFSTYYSMQKQCGYPCVQEANKEQRYRDRKAGLVQRSRFSAPQKRNSNSFWEKIQKTDT